MAEHETDAIASETFAPKAPRAPYRKPELECLGSECTEVGFLGPAADFTNTATANPS